MSEWRDRLWAIRRPLLLGGAAIMIMMALGGSLVPVVVGFLLAYLVSPLVTLLTKWGVSRGVSVWLVFGGIMLGMGVLVGIGVPLLLAQVQSVLRVLPLWVHDHYHVIRDLCHNWGIPIAKTESGFIKDIYQTATQSLSQSFEHALQSIGHVGDSVLQTTVSIINFALFPIFFFHFLYRLPRLYALLFEWMPPHTHEPLRKGLDRLNTIMGGYIRGQLMVCTLLGGLYAMGLWILGVPGGIAIGMMTGYLNIIPYVGFSLGMVLSVLTAFLAGFGTIDMGMVVAVLVVCQLIESFILTPKLVGKSMGLDPLVVIMALMIGANVGGMMGMVIAVPVAAVLVGIIKNQTP